MDLNVLCLATYFKGERFMREAAAQGARVYLLTVAKLLMKPWPRDILADVYAMRDGATLHVLHQETSDGHCEESKQGPLDVCDGFAWHLVADVRIQPSADLWEIVKDEGKDLDCGEAQLTERLTRP